MTDLPTVPLVRRTVRSLVPHEDNPRKITPARRAKLQDKLKAWGDLGVYVFNERTGRLLSGHQRAAVMAELGMLDAEVDVRVGTWDEPTEHAIMQALNEHDGQWDHDRRALGLQLINQAKPELLPLTGLHPDKIRTILEGLGVKMAMPKASDLQDPDAGEKPKNPVTKPGDVWLLGPHRLLCGDALDPASYARVLAGEKADMLHTDPPWGVGYVGGQRQNRVDQALQNDQLTGDGLYGFNRKLLQASLPHVRDDGALYLWHAEDNQDELRDAMRDVGVVRRQTCFWFKAAPGASTSDYRYSHEPCYYAAKQGQRPRFFGDKANFTVWTFHAMDPQGGQVTQVAKGLEITDGTGARLWIQREPPVGKKARRLRILPGRRMELQDGTGGTAWLVSRDSSAIHPTQKPVALVAIPLGNSCKEGELVLDPFGGAGSTLLAAEQLKRRCAMIELDAGWCDVIVRRWEKLTGQKATLETKP